MRKITILEVLDPVKNEFVPIRQAINQGLFNTKTYLFFDPIENKHYSITEAAQRGLFKSAIDLRPEALIVERVKIAQTVQLLSARDPHNLNKLIDIKEAIENGIVDTNLRIYRNVQSNQVIDLSDAIERGLVQVKIVRETTEKITETVTEKKTPDTTLGLIKKTETSSSSKTSLDDLDIYNYANNKNEHSDNEKQDDEEAVKLMNGYYLFDRTKSLNINKRMKNQDDDITAGFISDRDSRKLLDQSNSDHMKLKSILKSDPRSTSPLIDFNEAVLKNLIILPDSLLLTQSVQFVIDLNSGNRLDFDEACNRGIIDVRNKKFIDTRDKSSLTLFEALNKNYIIMKDELENNYADSDRNKILKSNLKKIITPDDILSMFNPISGIQISVSKAISSGIYDIKQNAYIDLLNKRMIPLREAVDKGLVVLKPNVLDVKDNQNDSEEEYVQLNIKAIKNPINGKEMPLNEAIAAGFLDYAECEFHDPVNGKTYTLLDAYDKGYLIMTPKPIDNGNQKQVAQQPTLRKSRKGVEQIVEHKEEQTIIKKTTTTTEVEQTLNTKPTNRSQSFHTISNLNHSNKNKQRDSNHHAKSQSPSNDKEKRKLANDNNKEVKLRAASSFDIKSFDRLSMSSRKSVIRRIKEKMFGKKSKSNILNEDVIVKSMKIIDTKKSIKLTLLDAIKNHLAIPDDKLIDTLNERELAINEAIENSVIKFFHPINNFEFKYEKSCYIFGSFLLLVNYVINPENAHHRIGLQAAFTRNILDRKNGVYHSRKGPVSLVIAIEKGYLSCEMVDLNLLQAIITSNIFKYSTYKQTPVRSLNISNKNDETNKVEEDESKSKPQDLVIEQIKNKIESNSTINNNSNDKKLADYISKDLLKSSGIEFDDEKNYVIKDIYDSANNEYISINKAKRLGILNLDSQEYIDSKTGDATNIALAIRRNKIRVEEFNLNKQRNKLMNASKEVVASTNGNDEPQIESVVLKREKMIHKKKRGDTMTTTEIDVQSEHISIKSNMDYLDESDEELKEKKRLKEIEQQIRRDMSPIKTNNNDSQSIMIDNLSDTTFTNNTNNESKNDDLDLKSDNPKVNEFADSFNICKSLLYKLSNGRLIKFDKLVESEIYDKNSGKFRDSQDSENYVTLNEGLESGLLKLNDSFVLFDDKRIYVIESVMHYGRKLSMIEAVNKNIIDKRNCTYFINNNRQEPISIKEAMKNGHLEGKILTNSEIRWMLNDYAKKIEFKLKISNNNNLNQSTISTSSKKSTSTSMKRNAANSLYEIKVLQEDDDQNGNNKKMLTSSSLSKIAKQSNNSSNNNLNRLETLKNDSSFSSLETFQEFFVYDAESEQYISLNDAFYNGNVLNEPVRVRDPTNGFYILLKDAIIKGLISTQQTNNNEKVDFKNRSTFVTFDRVSYIVDHVFEPRKRTKLSCQEAARRGLFINGIYKHPYKQESLHIEDAISNGYVVGKRVDLNKIEDIFKRWLTLPPTKPSRGVYLSTNTNNDEINSRKIKSASTNNFQTETSHLNGLNEQNLNNNKSIDLISNKSASSSSKTKALRKKKFTSEETILRSNIQPVSGKISLIKDVLNERYLRLNEAERLGIINFTKGLFKNTLTKDEIQINEAIEKGYILLDNNARMNNSTSFNHQEELFDSNRLRSASSKFNNYESSVDDLDPNSTSRIEVAQQFEIVSITDKATNKNYDLESAINLGLFDIDSAMYIDRTNNERLTLIEAIDQSLIKISDETFRTSYKFEIENKNNKKTTISIRYVVDPLTQDIIPINVAYSKKLVDLDDGYYVGVNKLNLREAYEKSLILTKEDLDDPESKRARFNVVLARKSTNGKNMSVKSALAKNWLNIGRRVYIDKQTNEEVAFSQAVDMDLLVLRNIDLSQLPFMNAKKIQREEPIKSKLVR